jgi:biopolymer transport protein ExbB
MDLLISGGVVLLAIAVLSIYAVYLFLVRFAKLSRERLDGDALMARVNAAVRDRDLELALDACEQHGGPISRTLHAALLRLPYGRQAVEAAFQDASLQEEQRLTRGLRPLATIAQVAPLLGLLGTVTGMIIAFGEISGSGTGNPALLAGGIGQALVTTAAGLIVAIPTLVGQSFLASKVDTILLEIDRRREELMANVVQAVAARKDRDEQRPAGEAPAAGAAAADPTPARRAVGAAQAGDVPSATRAGGAVVGARVAGESPTLFDDAAMLDERPLPPRAAPVGPSMAARATAAGPTGTAPTPARLQVRRDPDESEG